MQDFRDELIRRHQEGLAGKGTQPPASLPAAQQQLQSQWKAVIGRLGSETEQIADLKVRFTSGAAGFTFSRGGGPQAPKVMTLQLFGARLLRVWLDNGVEVDRELIEIDNRSPDDTIQAMIANYISWAARLSTT